MQSIDRYELQGELGRGAMGVVYRALDPSIGRTVAIKTIRLTDLADLDERARLREHLLREARSAGGLSHPGIVTIYDVGEKGDTAYIAMEFVDGPSLERLFRSETADKELVLDVLRQTAAALDYAHSRGVIHRDIKPANILLSSRTHIKLTDFGVAKLQSAQATQAGTMMGTPNYMSPEQIQGGPVTGRSDQFSLGVIAYELLTGEKPFVADSLPALVFKIVKDDPAGPQRLNPTLGWPVDTVLKRALAKNPDDRFPNCAQFAKALENALNANKAWRPMAAGSLETMPTIVDRAPGAAAAGTGAFARMQEIDGDAVTAQLPPRRGHNPGLKPPEGSPPKEAQSEKPPLLIRLARMAAILIVGGAVLWGLLNYGWEYLNSQSAGQGTAQPGVQDETRPAPTAKERAVFGETNAPPAPARRVAPPAAAARREGEAAKGESLDGALVQTRIVTNPPGAAIEFDSNPDNRCTTPCDFQLQPGRHTLAAAREGYRRSLRIFEVPRDSEVFVNLDQATGTVIIRSEPPGASISVDGQARQEKTPASLQLPTGSHVIEVAKEGFKTDVAKVTVKDSAITNIGVNWTGQ